MIAGIRARLRCRFGRHDWSEFSSWSHAGRGVFVRHRHCTECGAVESQKDG